MSMLETISFSIIISSSFSKQSLSSSSIKAKGTKDRMVRMGPTWLGAVTTESEMRIDHHHSHNSISFDFFIIIFTISFDFPWLSHHCSHNFFHLSLSFWTSFSFSKFLSIFHKIILTNHFDLLIVDGLIHNFFCLLFVTIPDQNCHNFYLSHHHKTQLWCEFCCHSCIFAPRPSDLNMKCLFNPFRHCYHHCLPV